MREGGGSGKRRGARSGRASARRACTRLPPPPHSAGWPSRYRYSYPLQTRCKPLHRNARKQRGTARETAGAGELRMGAADGGAGPAHCGMRTQPCGTTARARAATARDGRGEVRAARHAPILYANYCMSSSISTRKSGPFSDTFRNTSLPNTFPDLILYSS